MIKISVRRTISKTLGMQADILNFHYEGKDYFMPLEENDGEFCINLSEKRTQDLMNIFIQALRDLKEKKVSKHIENSQRIQFIGIDYS